MYRRVLVQIKKRHCYRYYQTSGVRVRFAPSPTGYLHLGGLRTALYNYLFAKSRSGSLILRIEDTDQSRLVAGASEQIVADLTWAGIQIDEGPHIEGRYGPYNQSERLNIYSEQVKHLLGNGSAYYCFCTDRRLDLLRKEALRARQVPKYDNRCRHLSSEQVKDKLKQNEAHCVRFKLTSDCVTFEDMIYGVIAYDVAIQEGDPVIVKSDGFPTYHFANVVDDHLMNISHVLRGVEWQVSTTKHLLMYRAFDWTPPAFGHLPLLMNSDGSKFSKRQGDVKIENYRKSGIFPQALINFVTLSGGGFDREHGRKPKSLTMDELIKQFDISKISTNSGRLMAQRLQDCNRLELRAQLDDPNMTVHLVQQVRELVENSYKDRLSQGSLQLDSSHIISVLRWSLSRLNSLQELVGDKLSFLWVVPNNDITYSKQNEELLRNLLRLLQIEDNFDKDRVTFLLKEFSNTQNVAFNDLMKTLRTVLSGLKEGPGVAEMMGILGKESTLIRIVNAIKIKL